MAYVVTELEKLKAQVSVIAHNHEVSARDTMGLIAKLKAKRLSKEDEGVLRKFTEMYGVDYDKIKPVREKGKKK